MKIGIITISDNTNNGNRLQNYALQQAIESLGHQPVTIPNVSYYEPDYLYNKSVLTSALKSAVLSLSKDRAHQRAIENWKARSARAEQKTEAFERFNCLIHTHDEWLSQYRLFLDDQDFDAFVTGSDQVFNFDYGRANRIDFLDFAKNARKISYAASIGRSRLPEKVKQRFKKYLDCFDAISVRENDALSLLQPLTYHPIEVVLDPTMLIDKAHWSSLADQAEIELPEKYILKLFLGNETQSQAILQLAQGQGYEIVDFLDPAKPWGPFEFLKAIRDADYVFTDSFHGSVFSILFEKDFYALRRQGSEEEIFTRLETLLDTFDLKDRVFDGVIEPVKPGKYEKAAEILKKRREESLQFLRLALSGANCREKERV